FTFAARGTGRVSPLKLEDIRIEQADFRWESDGQRFRMHQLTASLYGGRLTGDIHVPLGAGGRADADLRFDDLDLRAPSRDVPGLAFDVDGRAAGTLQAHFEPGAADLSAQINVQADRLRVQGLPGEDFRATIQYRKAAAEYRCTGQALGGRFVLQGRLPSRGVSKEGTAEGRLRVE